MKLIACAAALLLVILIASSVEAKKSHPLRIGVLHR